MDDRCTHIESLLPAFVEGALGDADAADVRAHVAACAACRTSLEAFTALEQSLVARRSEIPPLERFLPAFAKAPATAAHPSVLVRGFRAMMSVPGVTILLTMWAAMFALHFRGAIGRVLSFSTLDNLTIGPERLANLLVVLTNGNVWLLIAGFSLVALAITVSTGAMTLRYLRR